MNPNLTVNLRASRELRAEIEKQELEQINLALQKALPWLEQAFNRMNSRLIYKRHSQLHTAISDAMTACQDALDHIEDAPDQE
jgi:hypothetical protein